MRKIYDKDYIEGNEELSGQFNNLFDILAFKTITGLLMWDLVEEPNKTLFVCKEMTIHKEENTITIKDTDLDIERVFVNIDLSKIIKAIDYVIKGQELQNVITFVQKFKENV